MYYLLLIRDLFHIIITNHASGKRKSSSALVRIRPGTGQITVNGQTPAEYFSRSIDMFVDDDRMGLVIRASYKSSCRYRTMEYWFSDVDDCLLMYNQFNISYVIPISWQLSFDSSTLTHLLVITLCSLTITEPLKVAGAHGQFDIKMNVSGGGHTGEACITYDMIIISIRPNSCERDTIINN